MRLIKETHIDFIGRRRWAFLISGLIIVPGLISILAHKGLKMGLDFTGGVEVQVALVGTQPGAGVADIGGVRSAVAAAGFDDRNIQRAGAQDANLFLIHVQETKTGGVVTGEEKNIGRTTSDGIVAKLREQFPGYKVDLREVQAIGPKIGSELRTAAFQAMLLTMLLIMGYVAWRFELRFGVATVVALIHDVLCCLGVLSILNKEFTLSIVAALLTLVGYSVNDTIVVFDRIREELKIKQKRETYDEIFNGAINKTLSRTLLTSATTLWAVVALFLFGGEVIHDFVFVMLFGIVVGTYSSIAVAAPLVIEWQHRSAAREAAKAGGMAPVPATRRSVG